MMATALQPSECVISLPNGWVNARKFEDALRRGGDALGRPFTSIVVQVPTGCKLMVDVIIRLLSLCNQAAVMTKRVRLQFADGDQVARGYLSRIGFFDYLMPAVEVHPNRPTVSGAHLHRGSNSGLVEIARFNNCNPAENDLVGNLAATAHRSCVGRTDAAALRAAVFTIFGELIDNVGEHSQSGLDAFAVLQTYPAGNQVRIAVSDSGRGILQTLRPALQAKGDSAAALGDVELLVEMFRKGISRLDDDSRGNGLMACAGHAVRFQAELDVRLLNQRVLLVPSNNVFQPNMAYPQENLPLLWGTHISFSLKIA